jgi:anti-sigma factor RsiW
LERYTGGGLAAEERSQIELHLAKCDDCRKKLARLEATVRLLRGQPLPPVPEGFAERVLARAREQTGLTLRPTVLVGPVRWWQSALIPAQVAAVLLLGLAVGGFMGRDFGTRGQAAGGRETAQGRIVAEYNLDCLSEAPAGSLTDVYLRLALAGMGE